MLREMLRQMHRLLLLPLALLVACADVAVRPPAPQDVAPRLHVLDCGRITFADVAAFGLSNDETPVRELFVPCYLVEHPEGTLFWDAGLPLALAGQGDVTPEPGMTLRYDRAVTEQLAELGIDPAGVDWIATSHMHFDHVGAASAFPSAHLLIQAPEYQAAFVEHAAYPVFDPQYYASLADNPRTLLDGDHDVFGDGSVQVLAAPGHTPGHQVLLVNLVNSGPVLLSGDLWHFRFNRAERRVPVFNTNREQTLESMARIEQVLARTGAVLWLEHDLAQAETLLGRVHD